MRTDECLSLGEGGGVRLEHPGTAGVLRTRRAR